MFRAFLGSCNRVCGSIRSVTGRSASVVHHRLLPKPSDVVVKNLFSTLLIPGNCPRPLGLQSISPLGRTLLETKNHELNSSRMLTKYSLQKGKRKSVKAVLKRFYRLDWGIWIRTKCGRHKHIYKKSWQRRRRLRQHVFTNATQSWLLDTMVTRYWRRPKYIPDDPYNPYHKREEFPLTRKKIQIPEVAS